MKQLLEFKGRSFIEACIENLLQAGIEDLIVVLGHEADRITNHLLQKSYPIKIVVNEDYRLGMTTSVQKGLLHIDPSSSAFLIALVDQPQIGAEVVELLLESSGQNLIVQPRFDGKAGHPVIFSSLLKNEILLLSPTEGLNLISRRYRERILFVDVDSVSVLEDIDTPEEYKRQIEK